MCILDQKSRILHLASIYLKTRQQEWGATHLFIHYIHKICISMSETPKSPFSSTADSDLYSTTAEPNYDDYNLIMNKSPLTGVIVYVSIIFSIEIPMICLAIYAVYSLIKSKRAAPVFVMNLLISDLIQVVSELLLNVRNDYWWNTALITWTWTSLTGLYFMTCIAVERYILIAHPIWHRSHRSLKCLVCTSRNGWLIPLIYITAVDFISSWAHIMPLVLYAVIIVCFVGTCRSLSHSSKAADSSGSSLLCGDQLHLSNSPLPNVSFSV